MRRQRKLHQDAIDLRPRVQLADYFEQLLGGDAVGRGDGLGVDTQGGAGLDLVANVDLGTRVVARQNDGQPRGTALGGQLLDARFQLREDLIANAIAIEDIGHP